MAEILLPGGTGRLSTCHDCPALLSTDEASLAAAKSSGWLIKIQKMKVENIMKRVELVWNYFKTQFRPNTVKYLEIVKTSFISLWSRLTTHRLYELLKNNLVAPTAERPIAEIEVAEGLGKISKWATGFSHCRPDLLKCTEIVSRICGFSWKVLTRAFARAFI